MPIVLGYHTEVGIVGGRLLVMESIVDLVLIRRLQLVPTSVWRRLPYRPTRANGAPAGWTVGMGGGASRAAQEPATGGRGGAWKVRVGIDRFAVDLRGPRGPFSCCV